MLWLFLMRNSWHAFFFSGGGGAAGGGPVGADAGAAVPDVPGTAGAAAAVVPQGRCALAAARPPQLLHATLISSSTATRACLF